MKLNIKVYTTPLIGRTDIYFIDQCFFNRRILLRFTYEGKFRLIYYYENGYFDALPSFNRSELFKDMKKLVKQVKELLLINQ